MPKIEDGVALPGKTGRPLSQERSREPVHEQRAFESYELEDATKVDDKPWVRPTSLEAPPARPGFAQRWVRVSIKDEADPTNSSRKFREGWKPRPAETVPPSYQVPTIVHGKWAGAIGVEGMVLCEMPKPMLEKRRKFYEKQTREKTDAIEAELQLQSHPNMPISQVRKSVGVREVKIQQDE